MLVAFTLEGWSLTLSLSCTGVIFCRFFSNSFSAAKRVIVKKRVQGRVWWKEGEGDKEEDGTKVRMKGGRRNNKNASDGAEGMTVTTRVDGVDGNKRIKLWPVDKVRLSTSSRYSLLRFLLYFPPCIVSLKRDTQSGQVMSEVDHVSTSYIGRR